MTETRQAVDVLSLPLVAIKKKLSVEPTYRIQFPFNEKSDAGSILMTSSKIILNWNTDDVFYPNPLILSGSHSFLILLWLCGTMFSNQCAHFLLFHCDSRRTIPAHYDNCCKRKYIEHMHHT